MKAKPEKYKRVILEEDQEYPRFEKFQDRKKNQRETRVKK